MSAGVEQSVTEIFRDVFGDDTLEIRPDMTAADVEGWDSLTHVRLLLTIERKFGIRLTASEAARLKTVGDLLDLIQIRIHSRKG